jgi:hypothetical protein
MVKLLSSREGVRLLSTAIDQADATILSRYINLIRWRCADAGCRRLDDAGRTLFSHWRRNARSKRAPDEPIVSLVDSAVAGAPQ